MIGERMGCAVWSRFAALFASGWSRTIFNPENLATGKFLQLSIGLHPMQQPAKGGQWHNRG
jgi:hypothetical protein